MTERPVLRMIMSDKKELLDPRSLEGFQVGDPIALIYGPDLIELIHNLKEILEDYQKLYEKYQECQRVIDQHIRKQGGG